MYKYLIISIESRFVESYIKLQVYVLGGKKLNIKTIDGREKGTHIYLYIYILAAWLLASRGFAAIDDFYINFAKNLPKFLKNPPIFHENLTHNYNN